MKRFWLGLGILSLLIVLGIVTTVGMNRICRPISKQLNSAAQAAQMGNWEEALPMAHQAQNRWNRFRRISASVTNHEPMEEADAMFQTLFVFSQQKDAVHFSECCVHLGSLMDAIGEAQSVYWWTIF